MLGQLGNEAKLMLRSLSGRFVMLTTVVVIMAEVLILVPSVAQFRIEYLNARLERAQIASLALLATDRIGPRVAEELLRNAEVYNVVLRRDVSRELILSSPLPGMISASYDLRDVGRAGALWDAMVQLFDPSDTVIRIIGAPVQQAGLEIEITLDAKPLNAAMWAYLWDTSKVITVVAMILLLITLFFARLLVLAPIKRLIASMQAYAAKPKDARQMITPQSSVSEVKDAEIALRAMQEDLSGAMRQQERLVALGTSVAKISHDLRNILTTAQLLTDALDMSEDPTVKRLSPKLVSAVSRAVGLTEATLAYGRAQEAAPVLKPCDMTALVRDVIEAEKLSAPQVSFDVIAPGRAIASVDADQTYRAVSNLLRNAAQAMQTDPDRRTVTIEIAADHSTVTVDITDQGGGLPAAAQEHLFEPFKSRARQGGTGLGLSIAHELITLQGGQLILVSSNPHGTQFRITLPSASVN